MLTQSKKSARRSNTQKTFVSLGVTMKVILYIVALLCCSAGVVIALNSYLVPGVMFCIVGLVCAYFASTVQRE